MATEIRVPTLGESVTEATIGKWFKKVGDTVAADEPVVELETDKVTIEVPAPAAGVLAEIVAKAGETVNVGALLGAIGEGGAPRLRRSGRQAATPCAQGRRRVRRSTGKEAAAKTAAVAGEAASREARACRRRRPPRS